MSSYRNRIFPERITKHKAGLLYRQEMLPQHKIPERQSYHGEHKGIRGENLIETEDCREDVRLKCKILVWDSHQFKPSSGLQ